jgi:hypothetical protein
MIFPNRRTRSNDVRAAYAERKVIYWKSLRKERYSCRGRTK